MVYQAASIRYLLLAGAMLLGSPALAADVTPDRLVNADKKPQNWLMNHCTYNSQRYSPLDVINKDNVKDLNVGSGFDAPPMTFAVNGKQYVAITSGLSKIAQRRHDFTPELKYERNQTMPFVFGL